MVASLSQLSSAMDMSTSRILYVGNDTSLRVPVMEAAGFTVLRSKCSIGSIREKLAGKEAVDALVFEEQGELCYHVVTKVRRLSTVPFVFFRESGIESQEEGFDLVIPVLTRPDVWLEELRLTIQKSGELHRSARKLREESAAVRSLSRSLLRESSARLREDPINPDALWRGELAQESKPTQPDGSAEDKPESRPRAIKDDR
jgi:hypothetical protein